MNALDPESREFLADVAKFSQVLGRSVERDSADKSLTEIVEYVRVGVLNVQAELVPAPSPAPVTPSDDEHGVLH